MQIELRPPDSITPYDKNPRNNDAAVDAVAESIRRFGFRQPLVVDKAGVLIVGHTRLKAALKLGLAEVPVHVARELKPAQVKALRIADNKTHDLATWNNDLLRAELEACRAGDIDMTALGFASDDLAALLAPLGSEGLVDPDSVPQPPDAATTQPGDIWVLGNHRLMCGDSSKPADLDRLLDGQPVHLVNTDPPYNVKIEPRSDRALAAGNKGMPGGGQFEKIRSGTLSRAKLRPKDRHLKNDDFETDGQFDRLLLAWFGNISRVLIPGGAAYIWGGYSNWINYPPALKASGLYFSQGIIWIKEHPILTRKDFMGNHECCFYTWKEGAAHRFFGPKNIPDTWSIKKINPQSMIHLTEKPVELAARAMAYSSKPGENVLDLFGGSGSTLIGAEMTGRRAFLMELDALYCDVIVQRWEKFTGRNAERLPQPAQPS